MTVCNEVIFTFNFIVSVSVYDSQLTKRQINISDKYFSIFVQIGHFIYDIIQLSSSLKAMLYSLYQLVIYFYKKKIIILTNMLTCFVQFIIWLMEVYNKVIADIHCYILCINGFLYLWERKIKIHEKNVSKFVTIGQLSYNNLQRSYSWCHTPYILVG